MPTLHQTTFREIELLQTNLQCWNKILQFCQPIVIGCKAVRIATLIRFFPLLLIFLAWGHANIARSPVYPNS